MINKHILITPPDGLSVPLELSPAVSAWLLAVWLAQDKHPAVIVEELVEAALSGTVSGVQGLHGEVVERLQRQEDLLQQGIAKLIQGAST